jgi:hypothetical protein
LSNPEKNQAVRSADDGHVGHVLLLVLGLLTESTVLAGFKEITIGQNFWKTFMTMLILSVCSQSVLQFLWSLSNHHSMVSFSSATHPAELDH